jgi:hypothetical protein
MQSAARMFSAVTTGVLVAAAIIVFGHHPQPTISWLSLKDMVLLAMSDSVLDGAPVPACQLRQVVAVEASSVKCENGISPKF